MAVQQGVSTSFELASTNLAAQARAGRRLATHGGTRSAIPPCPVAGRHWQTVGHASGGLVTDHAEIVEAAPSDKLQEVRLRQWRSTAASGQPASKIAIGWPSNQGRTCGSTCRLRRAGSSLDGVLSIQNEQGAELAANDDRPGTSDPGLDFKVPNGVNAVVVAIRDLEGRGGPEAIYRISVSVTGRPDFRSRCLTSNS